MLHGWYIFRAFVMIILIVIGVIIYNRISLPWFGLTRLRVTRASLKVPT